MVEEQRNILRHRTAVIGPLMDRAEILLRKNCEGRLTLREDTAMSGGQGFSDREGRTSKGLGNRALPRNIPRYR